MKFIQQLPLIVPSLKTLAKEYEFYFNQMTSEPSKDSPIKELVSLLNKDDAEVSSPKLSVEMSPVKDVSHKKELQKLNRERKKKELEELRANQCRGITILMTQPNGKILTNKLTSEADYIEFIISVFDAYKLQNQITDYRILRGPTPDL